MSQVSAKLHGLLSFLVHVLLPSSAASNLIPPTDHFARHSSSWTPFEGYYTRVQTLDDNSTIVLIFSTVHKDHLEQLSQQEHARSRPWHSERKSHFILFALIPSPTSSKKRIMIERYPEKVEYTLLGSPLVDGRQSFELRAEEDGLKARYTVDHSKGCVEHDFTFEDVTDAELGDDTTGDDLDDATSGPFHTVTVSVSATEHTPLRRASHDTLHTPHSPYVELGAMLPLHWHVFSTCSEARYRVETRSTSSLHKDGEVEIVGHGLAHIEKNWGRGFPEGWTWMQAFSYPPCSQQPQRMSQSEAISTDNATLAVAGGKTGLLNLVSYLAIYRSPAKGIEWDFSVPWTIMVALPNSSRESWGPFVKEEIDRNGKGATVEFTCLRRKLVVCAGSEEVRMLLCLSMRLADDSDASDHANALKEVSTWLPLDCPLISGHGNVSARETFNAHITVKAYIRPSLSTLLWNLWLLVSSPLTGGGRTSSKRSDKPIQDDFSPWWALVETRTFENAAFELGGSYRSEQMLQLDCDLHERKMAGV